MDDRLTTKVFLRVFDCIRCQGNRSEEKYQLGQLYAWHDYDGYTCWISYKDVTVTLMFHGSLNIEYSNNANYADFINQCLTLTDSKPSKALP